MQNNSINSTIPNELVILSYEGKSIRVVIKDNEFIWASATDVMDALAYKNQAQELARLAPVHILKNEQIRLENGDLIQIDITNKMGIEALIKYAKASIRKPFKEWYYTHICRPSADEIRAFAQKPQEQSNQQSIDFQIFTFEEGDNIRIFLDEKGEPWFVALDVCRSLGYDNPWVAVGHHCEKDDLYKLEVADAKGRKQMMTLVNEANLYALILGSTKPNAKKFKNWVLGEVLPTLRKTGKYEIVPKIDEPTPQVFSMAQIQAIHNIVAALIAKPMDDMAQKLLQIEKQFQATLPKGITGKPSYVYLMLNLDNFFSKIGKANVPPSRLTELEANGSKMRLIKTIKLPYEELAFFWESTFQTMFSPFHEGREIYRLDDFQHQIFSQLADSLNAYYEDLIRRLEKGGDAQA